MIQFRGCVRLFERYARAFVQQLPQAVGGDVVAIHRTRVAARRLREVLPIVRSISTRSARRARRTIRRIRRALGPVRELDVTVAFLDERLGRAHQTVAALRRDLMATRGERRRRLRTRFSRGKVAKIQRAVTALVREVDRTPRRRGWRQTLVVRLARRVSPFRRALADAGSFYVPERQHAVRISAKRLRYALECAAATGDESARGLIRALRRTQRQLGRQHDASVLLDQVRTFLADHAGKPGGERLDQLATGLESECRRLHARYVRSLPVLHALVDNASQIAAKLALRPTSARAAKMVLPVEHAATLRREAGRARRANG